MAQKSQRKDSDRILGTLSSATERDCSLRVHPPETRSPMGCTPSLLPKHRISDICSGEHDFVASMAAIRRIIHDRSAIYDINTEKELRAHIDRMKSLAVRKQFSESLIIEVGHLFEGLFFRFPVAHFRLQPQCAAVLQELYQRLLANSILDQNISLSLKEKTGYTFLNTSSDLRGTMCTTEIKYIVVQGYLQPHFPTRNAEFRPLRHNPKSSSISDDNGYGFYATLDD